MSTHSAPASEKPSPLKPVVTSACPSFRGPEGLSADDHGNLYVGCLNGRLFCIDPSGKTAELANFSTSDPKARPNGPQIRGVLQHEGRVFLALNNYEKPKGAVYSYDLSTRRSILVASGLGAPNGLAIDPKRKLLYVTDSGPAFGFGLLTGRLWAIDLKAWESGRSEPAPAHVLGRFHFPNGLALTADGTRLFLSQTYTGLAPGRAVQLDLAFDGGRIPSIAHKTELARLRGWPDGILLTGDEKRLLIALQRTGQIVSLALDAGDPSKRDCKSLPFLTLDHDGIRCAPASLTALSRGRIGFTDLWTPSLRRIAFSYDGNLRSRVFQLGQDDVPSGE